MQRYAAHVSGATRTVHEHIAQPYLQANMGKACLIVLARHVAGACAAGTTYVLHVRHTQRWTVYETSANGHFQFSRLSRASPLSISQ